MKKLIVTILFVWLSVGIFSESWAQVSARSLGLEQNEGREIFQLVSAPPASFDSTSVEEDDSGVCPSPPPPRIFGGITTSISTGWLSNYQPNNLNGNALVSLSSESKFGYLTGIRLEYLLGNLKDLKALISTDVTFGRVSFLHTSEDTVLSTTSEKMLGQYRLATTASAFTVNVLYNFRIASSHLFLNTGIITSYIFNIEHSCRVTAGNPILPTISSISTSDSGRTMQYLDAATSDVNKLQIGLVAGMQYYILLGRSALMPFAQFEYGLNGMLKGGQAHPTIVRAGCAWIFAI